MIINVKSCNDYGQYCSISTTHATELSWLCVNNNNVTIAFWYNRDVFIAEAAITGCVSIIIDALLLLQGLQYKKYDVNDNCGALILVMMSHLVSYKMVLLSFFKTITCN